MFGSSSTTSSLSLSCFWHLFKCFLLFPDVYWNLKDNCWGVVSFLMWRSDSSFCLRFSFFFSSQMKSQCMVSVFKTAVTLKTLQKSRLYWISKWFDMSFRKRLLMTLTPFLADPWLPCLYNVYMALHHAFRFWRGQPLRAKTYWQPSVEGIIVI